MASPTFYGTGHTPRNGDTRLHVLQKILGALNDIVVVNINPTFLGGHTPRNGDTEAIVIQKILGAIIDLGAAGGSNIPQIFTGVAPPAAPLDPTQPALFYPTSAAPPGTNWQSWDVPTQAWI